MLAPRPNCELCDVDLPAAASNARICTYECTFCADCVENTLHNVCPSCGGGALAHQASATTTAGTAAPDIGEAASIAPLASFRER